MRSGEFAQHLEGAHTTSTFAMCMCLEYVKAGIMRLSEHKALQQYADAILDAWPPGLAGIVSDCVQAAMARGNVEQLRWLLQRGGQAAAAYCAQQAAASHGCLLADRPQFVPAVMAVVVCHGWCPWTSANPGVTVEVLHTATWAARGRFAGWNSPHVLSFLPMCTCHECAADHARFDRRVLCCADVPAYCGYFTESD